MKGEGREEEMRMKEEDKRGVKNINNNKVKEKHRPNHKFPKFLYRRCNSLGPFRPCQSSRVSSGM